MWLELTVGNHTIPTKKIAAMKSLVAHSNHCYRWTVDGTTSEKRWCNNTGGQRQLAWRVLCCQVASKTEARDSIFESVNMNICNIILLENIDNIVFVICLNFTLVNEEYIASISLIVIQVVLSFCAKVSCEWIKSESFIVCKFYI